MKLTCEPRIVSRGLMRRYRWVERGIVLFLAAIALWLILRAPEVDLVDPPFLDESSPVCPAGYINPQQIDDAIWRCTLDPAHGIQ